MTGDDSLKEILSVDEQAFVMMLTSVVGFDTVKGCIDSGASGYIRKDTPVQELKALIKESWTEHRREVKQLAAVA